MRFATPDGEVHAVKKANFDINEGECLGVVGESGSGKSQLFLAALGLAFGQRQGHRQREISRRGNPGHAAAALNRLRGSKITMIFQDPLTSLTPHMQIGAQIMEALRIHERLPKDEAEKRALEVLELVRIPEGPTAHEAIPA